MSCCAIHVIWTTYGTWLPGDDRGHWSPLFDLYGHLIERGHKLNLPDPTTQVKSFAMMKETPRILTPLDQQIVGETIGEVSIRNPSVPLRIHAAAIERTHVHLLLGSVDEAIEKVVGRLKGRTSSAVIARGSEGDRSRTWTAGYWKVYFFRPDAIPDVVNYIEEHNERRGLARRPYPWITPWNDRGFRRQTGG